MTSFEYKVKARALSKMGFPSVGSANIVLKTIKAIVPVLIRNIQTTDSKSIDIFPVGCGLGKSTIIQSFIEIWKESDFVLGGSILICLPTLAEIENYVYHLKMEDQDFAIISSDEELNSYGLTSEKTNEARVLLITHERFKILSRGRNASKQVKIKDMKAIFYKGGKRSLLVWDEGRLPAEPAAINLRTLAGIPAILGFRNAEFTRRLEALHADVRDLRQGDEYTMPAAWPSSDTVDALHFDTGDSGTGPSGRQSRALDTLVALRGQRVLICDDNQAGPSIVGAINPIPEDFGPAVILDASARVRATYRHWAASNPHVLLHPPITASFERVKFHIWKTAAGKSSLEDTVIHSNAIRHAADIINQDHDQWLIVHYKKAGCLNTEAAIRKTVDDPDRLSFVTWGNHCGTNEYRAIKKVFVLGSYLQGKSYYAGLHLACAGSVLPSPEATSEFMDGEAGHNFLQAICRSNVRNIVDGVAGETTVYMAVSKKPDPMALIEATFPGATVEAWCPAGPKMAKSDIAIIEAFRARMSSAQMPVKKNVMATAIGISAPALSRSLTRPGIKLFMAENHIRSVGQQFVRD